MELFSTGIKKFKNESKTVEIKVKESISPNPSDVVCNSAQTFSDLGIEEWLLNSLTSLSIKTPTEIQRKCIPIINNKKDLLASSKTGSGKTAAFAIPILQSLSRDPFGIFALILTPTRELAIQIAEQFKVFGTKINLKLALIVGGLDMMKQVLELSKKPHIVVATPGRLSDIIQSCKDVVHFKNLQYLVLDEADRLLESTFRPDLKIIVEKLNSSRQTLLFSATMSRNLVDIDFLSLKDPSTCHISGEYETVEQITQKFLLIPSKIREVYLVYLLQHELKEKSVIIFTGKCQTAQVISVMLKKLEIRNTALHSQMSQNDRIGSLAKFKGNIVSILLSTDVGSRGLDIPAVQYVINFDIPCDARDYVHRVGRTARAGLGGCSISFVSEYDVDLIKNIEAKTGKQLEEMKLPEKDILLLLNKVSQAKREAHLTLLDKEFGKKRKINKNKT